MNPKLVEDIANAVLYEGYMLYPYRPSSIKNRQRWNFGVVYPKVYSESQNGADNWFMQTECVVMGSPFAKLSVKVRFLQAVARTIAERKTPLDERCAGFGENWELDFKIVECLRAGEQVLQPWQEAIEREIVLPFTAFTDFYSTRAQTHDFSGEKKNEVVRSADEGVAGLIVQTREAIEVKVDVSAIVVRDGIFKVTVRISNVTPMAHSSCQSLGSEARDKALMQSLLSAHTILRAEGGEFVSLIDPPDSLKETVAACNNVGTWPVLAGEEGQHDVMLSSPIILYDYPQIAPESAGNLFDGTEIDEILALRILTLTDAEKQEMRDGDQRSREILDRTEAMPAEQFMRLHGVLRGLRSVNEGQQ